MVDTALGWVGVRGVLLLEIDGQRVEVVGEDDRLAVRLPDDEAFVAFVRGLPDDAVTLRGVAAQDKLLTGLGITLELWVEGKMRVRLGRDATPSLWSKMARAVPIEASLGTLLRLRSLRR